MVPTGSAACWPWSAAWFGAFELASTKLAPGRWQIGSVVVLSIIVLDIGVAAPCVAIWRVDEISKERGGREK
jgi:hypothetical protein